MKHTTKTVCGMLLLLFSTQAAVAASNKFEPKGLEAIAGKLRAAFHNQKPKGGLSLAVTPNTVCYYWTAAGKAAERAASELKVPIKFQFPAQSGDAQSQADLIKGLIAGGTNGIAISPINAELLKPVFVSASGTPVITMDTDAPAIGRTLFVGTDNVQAGLNAGKAMVKALGPKGGKVAGFVGYVDAQNAVERIKGIQAAFKGTKVTLENIYVDKADMKRAEENVRTALTTHPDLAGIIGIYAYNGPLASKVLAEAGKTKQVKLVSFDLEPETIAGLKNGAVSAAIGQRPFYMAYLSSYILYAMSTIGKQKTLDLIKRDLSGKNKDVLETGLDVVTPETLPQYLDYLKQLGIASQ